MHIFSVVLEILSVFMVMVLTLHSSTSEVALFEFAILLSEIQHK